MKKNKHKKLETPSEQLHALQWRIKIHHWKIEELQKEIKEIENFIKVYPKFIKEQAE